MKYIALTGQIASGKTAVAKALEAKGYVLVSYTDLLKRLLAAALTAIGIPTTLDDILADKERYRALIQEFGTVIGFDLGGAFIDAALEVWREAGMPKAVFDNVRTDEQANAVRLCGFPVVRLKAHDRTRFKRLAAKGVRNPIALLGAREGHPIEAGIDGSLVDVEITTDVATPEMIADFLANFDFLDEEEDEDYDDSEDILAAAQRIVSEGGMPDAADL